MFSVDSKLVGYSCDEGFRLIGSTTARCMQNGTWSSPPPECAGMIDKLNMHVATCRLGIHVIILQICS